MKILLFSLKRTLRTPLYLLFLLAVALLPPLFYHLGRTTDYPPAGYVAEDPSDPASAQVAAYLEEAGFLVFSSEEALTEAVVKGELDAGVVIPAGLTDLLRAGSFRKIIRFFSTPTSSFPDLWREHACTAIFAVYAPYMSADLLEETGITEEEVLDTYDELMAEGRLFTFTLSTRRGRLIPDKDRSRRFFLGAASLLLFLSTYFCVSAPLMESVRALAPRVGKGKALLSLYLPGLFLRALGLWGASFLACLAAEEKSFVRPLSLYLALLLLFHFLLCLMPGDNWKEVFLFFLTVFALALCPIYMDLSLLAPFLGKIRPLLPPFWLWMLASLA